MLITIPFANCLLVMLNFTRSVNLPMLVLGEKRKLMSYFIKIQFLNSDNTRVLFKWTFYFHFLRIFVIHFSFLKSKVGMDHNTLLFDMLLSSADFFSKPSINTKRVSNSYIQIRSDIWSGLILVQTVCKYTSR